MGNQAEQTDVNVKDLAVQVDSLTFGYGGPDILKNLNLRLPRGARCLLVGANGAGKTTLLRILAGKRMTPGVVNILGVNAFIDSPKGVTYLGTEWAGNPVVRSDLRVDYLLKSVGGDRWPERRDELIQVLDVDTTWRMHQVSDGQRRRVQLVMGLLAPWDILLLDEVTVDLDVLVRSDFLDYLEKETASRNSTIVYATHIFDGLGEWPTHIAHVADGTAISIHHVDDYPEFDAFKQRHMNEKRIDSPLMALCLSLLRKDKEREKAKKAQGKLPAIDPNTGLPHTKWDDLSEDMKTYGDKYFNYWKD
ncbi:P-loop containing nucleoside triphosphate hydrolase protein [Umbelopsis sp. PMI_123]|nr:P-loop containing nucleoside triphosphate hydrolase protein [Umbelopsis sp. PMI_123]